MRLPDVSTLPSHICLVDGSGYIFRAYHALPSMTRADGAPIGAVLGYANMLWKLLGETDADRIAVVFDAGGATFRHALYPAYKANRAERPADLLPQFEIVRRLTEAFGVCGIERPGVEADDLIATYARLARSLDVAVTIVSSDKDLMQLIGNGVAMFDPLKQRQIGAPEVRAKFGVAPDQVVDVLALAGDAVDNVPGVPGIGLKTAGEMIAAYGTLENLLLHAGEIKQPKRRQALHEHAEQARLSRQLVVLDDRVPITVPLERLAVVLERDKLTAFLRAQGFLTLLARVEAKIGAGRSAAPADPGKVERRYAPAAPQTSPLKAHGQERGLNPKPGFFRIKLVKGGPYVAAEIRHEPPRDPVTKEFLDRSYYWYAVINGEPEPVRGIQPTHKVVKIWLYGEFIAEGIYRWMLDDRAWAKRWAPYSAEANPSKAVDLHKEPIVF